ncbi:MAG: hypothetical protein ACRBB4_07100 [Neptuniibacter sp.]
MSELRCYFVGHIPQGSDEIQLAEPMRPNNLAVSFTESLSEFFFDFAEKHFYCEQGDDIVLMSANVDCSELDDADFIQDFKKKTESSLQTQASEVLKRRKAIASDSVELSKKVRENLYETHRLISQYKHS